jgi:hypothetical protein
MRLGIRRNIHEGIAEAKAKGAYARKDKDRPASIDAAQVRTLKLGPRRSLRNSASGGRAFIGCWKRCSSGRGPFGLWNNHGGKLLEYSVLRQRRPDTHPNPAAQRVEERCIFTIGNFL